MRILAVCKSLLVTAGSAAVAACGGGGGGGGVESTPPPPPPPPPQSAAVTIFSNPTPGTFASASVSGTITGAGTSLGVGSVSKADADQVHIRYSSDGNYEIQMPGGAFEKLTFAKGVVPQDPETFNFFQPASAPQNGAYLITENARLQGYSYSELAAWFGGGSRIGEVAFGMPTAAGQVPVSGSASYSGIVGGTSDVVAFDSFDGYYLSRVTGSVDLSFDFAKGSLGGSVDLSLSAFSTTSLGTFNFTDTVFSAGSTTYSGKFQTAASGQNYFFGQFTGPHAEETIGAWALPFQYDGGAHQAFGAWIAKKP